LRVETELPQRVICALSRWKEGLISRAIVAVKRQVATRVGIAAMLSGLSPAHGLIIEVGHRLCYRELQKKIATALVSCTSTPFAIKICRNNKVK